jgi:D-amino peptidase
MKILIAADMEGIGGVVAWDHVSPDHKEYARFRKLMTAEVNAAIRGACEGGGDRVVVADGHAFGRNVLIEELDPRAELHTGSPNPLGMVAGAAADVDGALFIGYHARAGTENAILDHTWSSTRVANLWLNGDRVGETGLNAALCGHFAVPVLMVSGDRAVCQEAAALLGDVETVAVKEATGRMAAQCLPPEVAQERIREAASRAVVHLRDGETVEPLRLPTPVTLAVEFPKSDMAEKAAFLPGAQRQERRVTYVGEDMVEVFRAMRSMLALAD